MVCAIHGERGGATATSVGVQAGFGGGISGRDLGVAIASGLASGWAAGGLSDVLLPSEQLKGEVTEDTEGASHLSTRVGDSDAHSSVPCGAKGNPSCGTTEARAKRLSDLERRADAFVKQWRNSPSPLDPNHKKSVLEASDSTGLEHAVGIVVGKNGEVRLLRTQTGGREEVNYDWERAGWKPSDKVIGFAHTHPTGNHFSRMDIRAAIKGIKEFRASGILHEKGFLMYLIEPKETGGHIFIFEPRRNSITPVK